ncbi:MAG: PKD domain-containing protein, partial [Bacteroidia bacterium]
VIPYSLCILFIPKPNFNSADICFGDVAIFKNTTTLNGNGVLKSHWEFNDPSGSTLDTSNYTDGLWVYEQYGDSVDVELSVTDNHYPKFWYTITKTIKVTPYPTINFSVVNECLGKPITIQNRTSLPSDFNGQIDYWLDFDGEYTATQEPLSYAFPTSGQRKLTLYASTNGCTSEQEKNAYQFESPVSDFSHQGSCNLAEVSFSNTSTIEGTSHLSYIWKFDKTESRHSDPKVTFDSSGAHSITLIANSIFGCSDTLTTTIVLKESPKADFEYNRACNKSATQFLQTGTVPNDGSNSSYLWDFDGINSSQEKNPSHLFTDIGKKKITLRIDDLNGCSHSTTKNIVVKTEAVADFTTNSTCARSIAVFGNSSTIEEGELSFKWDFGDGSFSTSRDCEHSYNDPATYYVSLIADPGNGCSDTLIKSIEVNALPDASFDYTFNSEDIRFNGPESNENYLWDFGDGNISTLQNPTHQYINPIQDTFKVCLKTKKGECWNEECQTIDLRKASVDELSNLADWVKVYPNPTKGKISIKVQYIDNLEFQIIDLLGHNIKVPFSKSESSTHLFDCSHLADGVYFVRIKSGTNHTTRRFVISK